MTIDNSDLEKEERLIRAKAKETRHLSDGELAFIDDRIAEGLLKKLRSWAVHRWWQSFGSQGHTLETLEDEARFIAHLDTIFTFPAPSTFLCEPMHPRKLHTTLDISIPGRPREATFYGPPPARLLELMLYGFFHFQDRLIFLNRSSRSLKRGDAPDQWQVLPRDLQPTNELGIRAALWLRGGSGKAYYSAPDSVFSNLPYTIKEQLALNAWSLDDHQLWMEQIADQALIPIRSGGRAQLSLELGGEYAPHGSYPLADFVATREQLTGKRAEPINGDYLDCRPNNLILRSSRGPRMKCSLCDKLTTARDSERIKTLSGSTARVCFKCQARLAAGRH